EASLIVEHRETKLLPTGGSFHVNRHHHAVIENLLISCGVEGTGDFEAAAGEHFSTSAINSCIQGDIHLLAATGVLGGRSVGVHKKDNLHLAGTIGLGLGPERDLGSRRAYRESSYNVLVVVMILRFSRLNGKIALAVADLRIALVQLYLDAAILSVPLLILGIVAERIRSLVVRCGQGYAQPDLILVCVCLTASFRRDFLHGSGIGDVDSARHNTAHVDWIDGDVRTRKLRLRLHNPAAMQFPRLRRQRPGGVQPYWPLATLAG